ncbi:MAG: NTP transferase domain-containing protein, partial [Cyanobacteria bacterium P01_A01_bin.135]
RDKTHGPLVGFYQGLGAIATEWTMLLACDLPRLRAAPLQRWAEHLTTLPEATTAYLPRWSRGWDPLCGFYRRRCHPDLGAFIAGGGRSFQQWLQQQAVAEISEAAQEAEIFYNCNTPQDWQQLHAEQS